MGEATVCSSTNRFEMLGSGSSRGVREFKRLSSIQKLMPSVVEETEDVFVEDNTCHNIIHDALAKIKIRSLSYPEAISQLSPLTTCTLAKRGNSMPEGANCTKDKIIKPITQPDSLAINLSAEVNLPINVYADSNPLHEKFKGIMDIHRSSSPAANVHTTNQLQGIPEHFRSSGGMAPDLTKTSEEATAGPEQSSPDLLRVDNGTDRRASSMPPLSPDSKQEHKLSMDRNTPPPKIESDTDGSQNRSRIFGRFSEADEIQVSEQTGEDLECQFVHLTSSLATQKVTLDKRVELNRHTRDIAEESLKNEVNTLIEEIKALSAKDEANKFEEELRNVERRLQIIEPIAIKLCCKSEMYGAVKQEQRQLVSAETMVAYVEHLKRLNVRESHDHQATRQRLVKAQQEWNGDMGDNSVSVNITRRCSTVVGGQTQTALGRRRASVSLTALPNILGGQGLKQFSMRQKSLSSSSITATGGKLDPKSRFQQLVRKSSLTNAFRRTSQDSSCSDYTELPAVTVSRPEDGGSPANSVPSTPIVSMTPRHSFSLTESHDEQNNNHDDKIRTISHVAVIKTISAVMPSVETIEKPEKGEVKTAIRRRRSMKRSDTASSSKRNSVDNVLSNSKTVTSTPSLLSALLQRVDRCLYDYKFYRSCKDRCVEFDHAHPMWKRQLRSIILILFVFICYIQINVMPKGSSLEIPPS